MVAGLRLFLTWRPEIDGRRVLFAALAMCFSIVAAARVSGGPNLFSSFGVPPGPSLFFDARNLTAAWECDRLGYDPLYDNPCDPWRRPLMYPRPWLLLTPLGLGQGHTVALALVLIAAMFLLFGAFVGRVPAGAGLLLAAAACSPAVMLAVERANMDIALLSLVLVALLWWRALPAARAMSPALVLLAATAKLYPVFALGAFVLTRNRVAARAAVGCMLAFVVYLLFEWRDVLHVATIATQGDQLAYGARILPAHLYHQIGADHWSGPAAVKQIVAAVPLCLLAAAIAVLVRRRLKWHEEGRDFDAMPLLGLYASALIYLGTFITANNFDYRLVFLLLSLPQLIAWTSRPMHPLSTIAAATLLGVLTLLWIGSLSRWLGLWDELASWAVAGLFAALLATAFPGFAALRQLLFGAVGGSGR